MNALSSIASEEMTASVTSTTTAAVAASALAVALGAATSAFVALAAAFLFAVDRSDRHRSRSFGLVTR